MSSSGHGRARGRRTGAGTAPGGPAGRRPPRSGHDRDPRLALVHAFASLWLEAEVGRRPLAQLFWIMDARLVARLRGRWITRGGPAGRVRHVSGTATVPGRFDAVAVVDRDGRVGALAVALLRDAHGWKVVEASCPERRPPPVQPPPSTSVRPGAPLSLGGARR